MTRGILFLPVAAVSLNSCSAFLVSTSSCRLKKPASTLRSTSFSCHANELVQRRPCQRRARSYSVSMMAKKKKGPAADALASLETLEALEVETEPAVTVEERPSLPVKKAKKKKGAKAKGPAADALAALEELEAKDTGLLQEQAEEPPREEAVVVHNEQDTFLAGDYGDKEGEEEKREEEKQEEDEEINLMKPRVDSKKKAKKGKMKGKGEDKRAEQSEQPDEPDDVETEYATQQEDRAVPPLQGVAEVEKAQQEETLEAKIRKTRPPPRVRISSSAQPGYVSLRLDGVAVTFRNQEVIKDATWEVKTGDRIGLVGPNGGGKTTQVKILAGELQPTAGEVVKSSKDLRVAFLRQEFVDELVMERSLKEELTSVFTDEAKILGALQACEIGLFPTTGSCSALSLSVGREVQFAKSDESRRAVALELVALNAMRDANLRQDELQDEKVQQDPVQMEDVLNRLAKLQEDAERGGVYDLSTKVQRIMDLMGFSLSEGDQPVSSFSGGWRMRIGLGKILLKDPNILLLDEPTNHLDMESVEWLESFLQNQNLPMVIVSHDREFLDRVCTGIVDTDGGVAATYPGNYSNFIKLKRARMDAWQASYRNQQKKIKEERNWINKFRTKGAWAAQVKSREKALDKLVSGDDFVKQPPNVGRPFRFRFPPAPRSSAGEEVLLANGISHGYNGRNLFENINLVVDKGNRIAFLGANGAGKSTLLRLVVGQEEPQEGACTLGSSVVKQYFEQNQADALDLSKTVVETMMGASTTEKYEDLRKLLGQFLFKGDAVEKSVSQLSGGEKARVALCKMMLTPANLLVLDEPTNHLDIPAKEMLEEALQHYEGAVLVVSHDRYFVSQVATTICNFEDKNLVRYDGDYRYFLERNGNLLEKVESRYVSGVAGIQKAKRVDVDELAKPKKNFGGKGGPSGRKDKGVKNAKRHAERAV